MAVNLSTLDFIAVAVYIAVLVYLGYSTSRRQSSEGFLIADRSLTALDTAASIVASKTGAGVMLTFVAFYYLYGISAMWIFAGVSAGYIIFIPFAVRLRDMSSSQKFYTFSDYFFYRHGKAVGYLSAVAVFTVTLLILLVQLIGGAKILTKISGLSYLGSLIIIVATILAYTVLGGFRAVIKTDKVQLLFIIVLMTVIGFLMARGSTESPVLEILSTRESPSIISILSFLAMGIFMPFFSAELWQRVYAARDVRIVKQSLVASAIMFPMIGFLLAIIGVSVSLNLEGIDPDLAMIEGLIHLVPDGFLGLGLVVFLASIMSSADSLLFANTSIVLQDFYARSKPVEKGALVTQFRYTIALLLTICFALSIWLQDLVQATYIAIAFGCVVSVVAVTSWCIKRPGSASLVVGMAFGFSGTVLATVFRPVSQSLVLVAVGFTVLGVLIGSVISLISGLRSRRRAFRA